jgi:hypothetical protein
VIEPDRRAGKRSQALSARVLNPSEHGLLPLPPLPSLGLVLHRAGKTAGPTGEHLANIMPQALRETLTRTGW